jgi:hypothetical protein
MSSMARLNGIAVEVKSMAAHILLVSTMLIN